MKIIEEAEWLVSKQRATHVLIDGIQNSVPEIVRGHLSLEKTGPREAESPEQKCRGGVG